VALGVFFGFETFAAVPVGLGVTELGRASWANAGAAATIMHRADAAK
jgi:hypothetical protein